MGAGPTGALLAILLERRGIGVTLYDARPDPRGAPGESGRSINLALADRGIHALRQAGVFDTIVDTLLPMRGRMIHAPDGSQTLQLYGQRTGEVLYSVSRHRLNQALLDVATARYGIDVRFLHRLEELDFDHATATVRDLAAGRTIAVPMQPLLAADGAGSLTRRRMAKIGLIGARETALDHGYKELSIPANARGDFALAPDALHIWPRGNFMLIALPNRGGSFTATLFLANHGAVSFEALDTPEKVDEFWGRHFADVHALMPDCSAEFAAHPTGFLGSVHADRWSAGGTAALIGDSAHAMVPFHGQGMNCCFEDCMEFDASLARHTDWQPAFEDYFAARKPNTDAIAAMALENYLEMRERVVDPKFQLRQSLALELERRHPQCFIPQYSMVTFHHEIPYRTAQLRGEVQARLLAALTAEANDLESVDYARAAAAIKQELPPLAPDAEPA